MKETLGRMNGAVLIVLAGFGFSLSGCFVNHPKKEISAPASAEKVIHIISVSPYPEAAKASAQQVSIAYQDPETMAFEFLREEKRPCEFRPGEANFVVEKDKPPLILPNAACSQ